MPGRFLREFIGNDDGQDYRTICAWCKRVIREGNGPLSHGICKPCSVTLSRRLAAERAPQARTDERRVS